MSDFNKNPYGPFKPTPHIYSPDYQAQGDCRVCGHTYENCNGGIPRVPTLRERLELAAAKWIGSAHGKALWKLDAAGNVVPDNEAMLKRHLRRKRARNAYWLNRQLSNGRRHK